MDARRMTVSASLVLYNTAPRQLKALFESVASIANFQELCITDNSPVPIEYPWPQFCRYEHSPANRGYGAGHNMAFSRLSMTSDVHLILNPDIYFGQGVVEELSDFLEKRPGVGLVQPRVLYPDGGQQFLCRLLPTVPNLFFRRFVSGFLRGFLAKTIDDYELRWSGYDRPMDVPFLSGCFMVVPTKVFKEIGGFDERYFMYAEDLDLCRTIGQKYFTIYYPFVSVVHEHQRESYQSPHMLRVHLRSLATYFSKWGWFFDRARDETNRLAIQKIRSGVVEDYTTPKNTRL